MPIYEYTCDQGHVSGHIRGYDERSIVAFCKDCSQPAFYRGLSAPSIVTDKPTAVILENGQRVVGTFGTPPKKKRQSP